MFNQLKDLYNLQKQAKEMQKQMANERVEGKSNDESFSITINGNHELISVNVSPNINLDHPQIEKNIKEAFSDAQSKLKSLLMEKFQGML